MFTTEEKKEMKPEMKDTFVYGKVTATKEDAKQCAVINILKNQEMMLRDDLSEATRKLGEATLDKENWIAKYECEMQCNVIKGQLRLVSDLQRDFENMMTLVAV